MKNVVIALCVALPALAQVSPTLGSCPVFPADHIWNTPIDNLPLHPRSANYISNIGPGTGLHPDFGSGTWAGGPIGIPYITVPGTQMKYPVTFDYADQSDPGPYAVPLNAPIEGGSNSDGDRHAIAADVDNCILYELYYAFPHAASWSAGSGAIFDLKGYALRPAGWTSADAAGLSILPGLVRYDEVASGEIRHALRFTVNNTQKAYIWPARHYASSITDQNYPPMGVRFRLRATFDVTPYPAEVQVILRCLQRYGMFLADNGSNWFISGAPDERWNNDHLATLGNVVGSDFEAVDESGLMIDPNSGQARQTAVQVTVSPNTANVPTGGLQQFSAVVTGTANTGVTWQVNGVVGGSSATGTIDPTGLYTAPSSTMTAMVEAVSLADPNAEGSAQVNVTGSAVTVTVTPAKAIVNRGTTLPFSASVNGTSDQRVAWSVNGVVGGNSTLGTISRTGLYTPPTALPGTQPLVIGATSIAARPISGRAYILVR